MSESYAGRSTTDILDLEQARSVADTLADAADRLHHGEGVSGPAADRYIAGTREFQATYAGGRLTTRQRRALLNNPRLQVFDQPHALLVCNHDPLTALCNPERDTPPRGTARTPSYDRCQPACPNIARTDTHITRAREEIDRLADEIATGVNPHPIQQRLRDRRTRLEAVVAAHQNSRVTVRPEDTADA
jgi:hypothetical protein